MDKLPTINIKGKEYVQVKDRVKYFRSASEFKGYSIQTEIVNLDDSGVVVVAKIFDASNRLISTGSAQKNRNLSMITKTSYLQVCETAAIGRALGFLGIGIDSSIASAEEVETAISEQEFFSQLFDSESHKHKLFLLELCKKHGLTKDQSVSIYHRVSREKPRLERLEEFLTSEERSES